MAKQLLYEIIAVSKTVVTAGGITVAVLGWSAESILL